MDDVADVSNRIHQFGWFHSIDLGNGLVTPGISEAQVTEDQLPDFTGRSVLDIGAWDGYYSFLAERLGASRVVSLDHYAWGVDIAARNAYWAECIAEGTLPDHVRDTTDFWRDDLPGQRGYNLAHEVLASSAEPVVADFMTVPLEELGTFDISLYLGVLYHMEEPLTALRRLRKVTREVAVIETEAFHMRDSPALPLLQFYSGSDVQVDFGNWYIPTVAAVSGLCRAAGFEKIETVAGPRPAAPGTGHAARGEPETPAVFHYRLVVFAYV